MNGEKNWFFHGDVFDPLIEKTKCLAQLGSVGYDFLLFFNRQLNQFLGALGKPRMTLSQKIKKGIKIAHEHVDRFEETAVKFAAKKKYANVICGHIHMPNIKHYSA